MPWYVASFPWLVFLLAAWLASGACLARALLKLRDGLEVAALALPLGLLANVLVANALGRVVFLPFALWWTALLTLLASASWLARAGGAQPLVWEHGRGVRLALLALVALLGLGILAMSQRELFGDDAGHASMAQLLAAGQFPLRFQCNPAFRAAYAYGGNLLAAQVIVVAGLGPFDALDVVKGLSTASVAALAFLAGWRPARRIGAGLLAVLLLFTVGPMVWVFLPLGGSGLAYWASHSPGLQPLIDDMAYFTSNPWRYGVVTPGFITTQFAHAHRAMAWGFAPLCMLLFLALLEAPLPRLRRTVALGILLAATALMQPGALLPLGLGFVGYWAWTLARRGQAGSVDASVLGVLAIAGVLALAQGGPVTDSVLDRLQGLVNPTTSFHFDPLRLPSCRSKDIDLRCVLLSAANLGLVPFLLPGLALSLWRRGPRVRLVLALGCAAAYAFPFFFRYDYIDWNIQRSITYASWTVAVLLAPLLHERLAAGGGRRALALATLLVIGWGGLAQLGVIVDLRWAKDKVEPSFWHLGPLDEELRRLSARLPLEAVILDAEGCMNGTSCRPAIVFGRYAASSADRLNYRTQTPAYARLVVDPQPDELRAAGFTHLYLDARWLAKLGPAARLRLSGGAFELLGLARDEQDFRALLRVCGASERCLLDLDLQALPASPGAPGAPAPPGAPAEGPR